MDDPQDKLLNFEVDDNTPAMIVYSNREVTKFLGREEIQNVNGVSFTVVRKIVESEGKASL